MYAPKQFREDRRDVLLAALRSIQFGALIAVSDGRPEAVHMPMVVREEPTGLVLEGHVALGNPFWKIAAAGTGGLAVFQGPQAYIHPGWYETKRATGKAVPTWNYVAVHVRGTLTIERDPLWLRRHLDTLTQANEEGRADPWRVSDAPDDYIDAMLRAIVGVRLSVDAMEGVWKMIQHHPESNRRGVIAGLAHEGRASAREMGALMGEREGQ
ncbi:transcriptional regulator [Ameyamaea chiangmaiensis NBRC 103196]|uniref:FMN-binding negative transcriptional regulator n=1 Tax=Ameyamaea chiangmaiensis TaxID=442969 RepID=A0A850PB59_9PROT|nr:FMN-binding negative transcriptional regulator [Ameyamaea chiangmaiensis]MBS4075924.1 FMN-binding negative transcriptional regulator [Ameyamaea chiangmaiensis]NVN40173.1 FMN-binding negative transcriptional regulator [Ameyamaea chiangmaiensis]GBQ61719.1 transcriptional regulator [Ameyamaea chiangmaiensis NBRC 103196]